MNLKASPRHTTGTIASYIHGGGTLGVLVEITCGSELVARSEEVQRLLHELGVHIAAANPQFIQRPDAATPVELCLYEQPYIKDESIIVGQMILGISVQLREEISVLRFARFKIGDPALTLAFMRGYEPPAETMGVAAPRPQPPKNRSGSAKVEP